MSNMLRTFARRGRKPTPKAGPPRPPREVIEARRQERKAAKKQKTEAPK